MVAHTVWTRATAMPTTEDVQAALTTHTLTETATDQDRQTILALAQQRYTEEAPRGEQKNR